MAEESKVRKILQHEYTWLATVITGVLLIAGQISALDKNIALTNQNIENLTRQINGNIMEIEKESQRMDKVVQDHGAAINDIQKSVTRLQVQVDEIIKNRIP